MSPLIYDSGGSAFETKVDIQIAVTSNFKVSKETLTLQQWQSTQHKCKPILQLPIWSSDATKDGYTIEQRCNRVDKAASTGGWTDKDTMLYIYNAFRGPALKWLEAFKRFGINEDSWIAVKAELLNTYSRVQTARTTVVNLADLKQGASESI